VARGYQPRRCQNKKCPQQLGRDVEQKIRSGYPFAMIMGELRLQQPQITPTERVGCPPTTAEIRNKGEPMPKQERLPIYWLSITSVTPAQSCAICPWLYRALTRRYRRLLKALGMRLHTRITRDMPNCIQRVLLHSATVLGPPEIYKSHFENDSSIYTNMRIHRQGHIQIHPCQ